MKCVTSQQEGTVHDRKERCSQPHHWAIWVQDGPTLEGIPRPSHGLLGTRGKWLTAKRKWKCTPNRESWASTQCKRDATLALEETHSLRKLNLAMWKELPPARTIWGSAELAEAQRFSQTWALTLVIPAILSYKCSSSPHPTSPKRNRNPSLPPRSASSSAGLCHSDSLWCNMDHRPREKGLVSLTGE